MTNKPQTITHEVTLVGKILGYLFGTAVLAAALINTFWGNDAGFGVFLILLSLVYFLPVNSIFKNLTGYSVPGIRLLRILLALFIIWASLGVGELFEKIELMKMDF